MRFRSRSVRARIIALLLVPLASLTGLWAYTTATSVNEVWGLIRINTDYPRFGLPADYLARSLQDERRAAVTYSADPSGKGNLDALRRAEAATDRTAADMRAHASDNGQVGSLTKDQRTAVTAVVTQIKMLPVLRAEVANHRLQWMDVYQDYTDAQTPFFTLQVQLSDQQAGDLTREAGNLIELFRAREYISREDALMYGARATGSFGTLDYQAFLASSQGEQLLFQTHEGQLPAQEAALYQNFTNGPVYGELGSLETAVSNLGQPFAAQRIDGAQWQSTLDQALTQLGVIDSQAVTLAGGRAKSLATGVIWQDAGVGAVGLIAVLVSVMLSLSIGRRLVRELSGLRDSAFELAGVRLPEVMRRLREGERVDLAAEVPQVPVTDGGRDELAQVSRAFNAVQRSAVEAAVEQAELRRGIAAVFVNLARRSQALLHRQLTLLDEMERRVEDPDELEDLFRLDHLTTRMRRHAEGLIILSGSAPGRNWRRPVRILDVVRAAVGEVEDYARVLVHRMPPVAVVGGAVSDVVHLVAELVENAAVFSPPHTQVRIQGEEVANGFVLEIDDRGLGMGEEAMAAANTRLATGGDFDLADTDRLGLFVISRLSARHGVRVSLRHSPYGGTTAVVLLPRELLAEVPARAGDNAGDGVAAEGSEADGLLEVNRHRAVRELPKGGGGRVPEPQRGPRHAAPVPAPALEVLLDGEGGEHGVAALPRRRPAALASRADSYLAAREGVSREGAPRDGAARDAASRDAASREGASRDGVGQDTAGRGTAVPDATGRDAVVRDSGVKDSGTPDRRSSDGESGDVTRELTIRRSPSAAKPALVPGLSPLPRTQPASTPPGPVQGPVPLLPRRVRQANLAPQLRARPDADTGEVRRTHPSAEEPSPQRERSPEEARDTFASFQRGLSRGRATPVPATPVDAPTDTAPAARASGTHDPSAEGTVR